MIEFCLRLNLQSRSHTGALTERTGDPNGNLSKRKIHPVFIETQPIPLGKDFRSFEWAAAVEYSPEQFGIEGHEFVPCPVGWHQEKADFS